jgi:hypothetical protein
MIDKKTCQKYIAGLQREGYLAQVGGCYMLSSAGFAFLSEFEPVEQQGEALTSGEKFPSGGEKFSPGGEKFSPGGEKFSPDGEKFPSGGEKFSPGGEKFSPGGEKFSPSGGEKFSPDGEKFPSGGEKFSPGGEKFPSGGEKFSPDGEKFSPGGEKFSPLAGKNSQLDLDLDLVVVGGDSLKTLTTTTTTTESGKIPGEKISPPANPAKFHDPVVEAALEHAHLLFDGATVVTAGLDYYLHREKVLGWLAYAYERRDTLYGPAGLVRNRLKDPSAPAPSLKYMRDPYAFFPDNFLEAIGKWHRQCPLCGESFTSSEAYRAHLQTPHQEFECESDDLEYIPDKTITEQVRNNWRNVLVNLRGELPPTSFETWVEDTVPVHYEDGVLQVMARNSYARKWLTERVGQRAMELAGCRVEFVAQE